MIQFNRKTGLPYSGIDLLTAQRILEDGALRLTFSQCIYVGVRPAEAVNLTFSQDRELDLEEIRALADSLGFNALTDLVRWEDT